jgi:hypothetical protein
MFLLLWYSSPIGQDLRAAPFPPPIMYDARQVDDVEDYDLLVLWGGLVHAGDN